MSTLQQLQSASPATLEHLASILVSLAQAKTALASSMSEFEPNSLPGAPKAAGATTTTPKVKTEPTAPICPPSVEMKTCTLCGATHPATADHFHIRASTSDGLASQCKACANSEMRKWRQRNREEAREIAQRASQKFSETHPEQSKALKRQWHRRNRDEQCQKMREYRLANV